jgi:hypothetical protein
MALSGFSVEKILETVGVIEKVKNLKNTDGCPYNNGIPWIDWSVDQQQGKKKAGSQCCSNNQCHECKDVIGGHVYKVPDDNLCYIVPLCKSCNSSDKTESFLVDSKAMRPILEIKCEYRGAGCCKYPDGKNG